MIGKLTGVLDLIANDHIIIDVNGVGYLITCPTSLLSKCNVGDNLSIYIHTQVKEEQIILFGFSNLTEKEWFLRLQEVQGVGAKMALHIISNMSATDIINAILAEDISSFKQIPGIGPKIAARIVNELKNHKSIGTASFNMSKTSNASSDTDIVMDAVSVLTNLGFNRKDAFVTASGLKAANNNIDLETLIKESLSILGGAK